MGVSIRDKNKDGIWWVFVRYAGQRVSEQVGSEALALEAKAEIEKEIRLGKYDIAAVKAARTPKPGEDEKPQTATVQEYYDKTFQPVYLDSAVAQSTAASYKNNFKQHINKELGTLRLDEIGHDKMEEFVAGLVKKKLAKATIQTIIKDLCTFFNHARKRKLVVDNPASGLSQLYSQAKAKHEVIEPLTKKEVPIFLKAVHQHSPQHYAMFFTGIHTGVRQGELAGLKTGDIDFNGKYLVVQRSIDRVHGKVVPTKTKRIRRVDLSDELISVLKEHVREQKESWLAKETPEGQEKPPQPEWLFPNQEGSWPDMANIADRHFHRCMEKAGLHRRRPYDMRHSFASLLLTAGAPIAYVSEQMGHQNIQLTVKLYGHLQPGANRHWMNKLPGTTKKTRSRAARTALRTARPVRFGATATG